MSVLIKDVDKELYKKFKAKAVLRGIKVGTALSLAIEKWLQDDNILSDEETHRIKNKEIYTKLLPKLLQTNENHWLVISEGEFIDTYKTHQAAIEAVKSNNLFGKVNIVAPIIKSTRRVIRLGLRRKNLS